MASGQVGGEAFVHTASVCYPSLGQISGHQGGILLWQTPILPPLSPSGPQAVSPTHAWSSHYSPSELCGGCCYILVTTFCSELRAFAHTLCCLEISLAWLYLTISSSLGCRDPQCEHNSSFCRSHLCGTGCSKR